MAKKKESPEKIKDPNAVELGRRGGKKGGKARIESMTTEERRDLGRRGAAARWATNGVDVTQLPRAIAEGVLKSGIQCAVLDDERRVLSHRGVGRALGRTFGGVDFEGAGALPFFLSPAYLKPFISDELRVLLSQPIVFWGEGGANYGVPAEALPQIFNVWVQALAAGALKHKSQLAVARTAASMQVALQGVAMIALVDEATGYQYQRARDSLAQILERFIAKEMQGWARTFEPDFYRGLFRLQKWAYDPTSVRRPRQAAALTSDIVYQRLAPGVRDELKKLAKKYQEERGLTFQPHLHRGLSKEYGWIKLREHLASVTTLLDIAPSWEWFMRKLDQRHPRYGKTLKLPFKDDDEDAAEDVG